MDTKLIDECKGEAGSDASLTAEKLTTERQKYMKTQPKGAEKGTDSETMDFELVLSKRKRKAIPVSSSEESLNVERKARRVSKIPVTGSPGETGKIIRNKLKGSEVAVAEGRPIGNKTSKPTKSPKVLVEKLAMPIKSLAGGALAKAKKTGRAPIKPQKSAQADIAEAVRAVQALCLSPNNRVSKEVASLIMRQVEALALMARELATRGSVSEGKAAAASSEQERVKKTLQKAVGASLKAVAMQQTKRTELLSYASIVRGNSKPRSRKPRPAPNLVKIFPSTEGKYKDSDDTKKAVLDLVNPTKNRIQVKSVRRIHNGGIAIETKSAEELKVFLESKTLRDADLKAQLPEKRRPLAIIYDVPREMEESDLMHAIRKQNFEEVPKEELLSQLKVCFKIDKKKESASVHYVVEVDPTFQKTLLRTSRLYLGWSACRVKQYIVATKCYKCQTYGHVARHCRSKEDVCGHCAESGHSYGKCESKGKPPACPSCKGLNKPYDHLARNKDCPTHKVAIETQARKFSYV